MNLLEAIVLEVRSAPEYFFERWFVSVRFICEGVEGYTDVMSNTMEEALAIKPGYKFLH